MEKISQLQQETPSHSPRYLPNVLRLVLFVLLGAIVTGIFLDVLGINLFRSQSMDLERNTFCIFVIFLALSVFSSRLRAMQPLMVMVLFSLSQYYQVALGWDVTTGALSGPRLLPLIAQLAIMCCGLAEIKWRCDNKFLFGWLSLICLCLIGISSLEIVNLGWFYLVVFGIQVPLWIAYLREVILPSPERTSALVLGGWISFIVFGLGTIVVIRLGSNFGLAGGLEGFLAARGVSEFNLVLCYLVLLWPLALCESVKRGPICLGFTISVFILATLLGLSRTGLFLVPGLILLSIILVYKKDLIKIVITMSTIACITVLGTTALPGNANLLSDWQKRLDVTNLSQISDSVTALQPGGNSSRSRDILREEAFVLNSNTQMFGQGFGAFSKLSRIGYSDPHSISFLIYFELGLVGLGVFYAFLGKIVFNIFKGIKNNLSELSLFVLPMTLVSFIFASHSVGGGLLVANTNGFSVNSTNVLLLSVLLFPQFLLLRVRMGASEQ